MFSSAALGFAVVVKLVRTLMIIPITLTLSVVEARRGRFDVQRPGEAAAGLPRRSVFRFVPWFLIGFLVVAAIASTGMLDEHTVAATTWVSVFLVTCAMAGIGLSTDLHAIRAAGWRPLALGGTLSLLVAATTLAVMAATGAFAAE